MQMVALAAFAMLVVQPNPLLPLPIPTAKNHVRAEADP